MIIPTLLVQVERTTGSDVYGQPQTTRMPSVKVSPVKLKFTDQHTSVRTDSAGSHGAAIETVANIVVLVKPNAGIEKGDVLTIYGNKVRVTSMHPRLTAAGALDHYQIECEAWTE